MIKEILLRRSIRKYKDTPVPREIVEEILRAGTLAPSSKNRQPWRFVVVSEKAKASMLEAMERGLQREEKDPLIPDSARHLKAAWTTLNVMRQAPVTIFIVNPLGIDLRKAITAEERIYEICNAQSIGANIENMTLTATDLGLGSLWICDTYFAYDELMEWLNMEGTLVAAIVLGYADESPVARPRKAVFEIVEWRE